MLLLQLNVTKDVGPPASAEQASRDWVTNSKSIIVHVMRSCLVFTCDLYACYCALGMCVRLRSAHTAVRAHRNVRCQYCSNCVTLFTALVLKRYSNA
eukprot:14282-Heterococcus_DN1.PRE.3